MKLNLGKSNIKPLLNHQTLDPAPLPIDSSLQGSKLCFSTRHQLNTRSPRGGSLMLEKLIQNPIQLKRKSLMRLKVSRSRHTETSMYFERNESTGFTPAVNNVGIQIDTIKTHIKTSEDSKLRLNQTLPQSIRSPSIYDINQQAFLDSPGNRRNCFRLPLTSPKRIVLIHKELRSQPKPKIKEFESEISTQESNRDDKTFQDLEVSKPLINFCPTDFSEIAVSTSPSSLLKLTPFKRFLKNRSNSVRKENCNSTYITHLTKDESNRVRIMTSEENTRRIIVNRRHVSEIFERNGAVSRC